jgi:hypothetical protein
MFDPKDEMAGGKRDARIMLSSRNPRPSSSTKGGRCCETLDGVGEWATTAAARTTAFSNGDG